MSQVHTPKDSEKLLALVNGVGGDLEKCKKPVEFASVRDKARCSVCVYKRSIPGNAHIQCAYNWIRGLEKRLVNILPLGNAYGIGEGLYMFPVLYDPVWQIIKCQAFSTVIYEKMSLDGRKDAIVPMMATYQLIQNYALNQVAKSGGKDNVEEGTDKRI